MKDDEGTRPPRANADETPDVAQLRREAEDARAELADSLHELRTRLSPSEVLAQTKTSVQTLTEHATATVAAQVKRGAEDLKQQVALRSQQAVHAVQDRPATVAATTAAAAGVFWFLSRDKAGNGHRRNGTARWSSRARPYRGAAVDPLPSTAGDVPGGLPSSARAPAPFDPADSTPHDESRVMDEQDPKGPTTGRQWRHMRPGPFTTGAAAALVTTAVLARRASSNQARRSGEHSQAHWEQAQAVARGTVDRTSERAREAARRARGVVGRIAAGPGTLHAGPAAAVGAAIGIVAALWLPRTRRELQWSKQVQQSMTRSVSSATRRVVDQAKRSALPTLAALLNVPPAPTRGH